MSRRDVFRRPRPAAWPAVLASVPTRPTLVLSVTGVERAVYAEPVSFVVSDATSRYVCNELEHHISGAINLSEWDSLAAVPGRRGSEPAPAAWLTDWTGLRQVITPIRLIMLRYSACC